MQIPLTSLHHQKWPSRTAEKQKENRQGSINGKVEIEKRRQGSGRETEAQKEERKKGRVTERQTCRKPVCIAMHPIALLVSSSILDECF